ncbi:MAG: lamin tail domain-containing protein [Myxococcales bacterium]|nr:lamin tail domain-containing protein [Myxococcales bacterium]
MQRTTLLLFAAGIGLAGCNGDDAVTSDTASTTDTDTDTTTTTSTTATTTTTSTSETTGPTTSATDTDPTATDTDPTATDTDPTATDTDPTATDTDPTATDTDPTATDTDTDTGTATDTDTTGGLEDDTIYDIQQEIIPPATDVDVQGVIVTAKATGGIFVQEPPGGEYSGVWVYVGDMGPDISGLQLGDEVDVMGVADDFNGLTEINASMGMITPTGNQGLLPAPELVDLAVVGDPIAAEPWEGVLIRIEGEPLGVVEEPGFDEFVVSDMVDSLYVDEMMYDVYMNEPDFPDFGVGASFTAINGPLHFSFDNFKIAPRMLSDLEGYMPPEMIGLSVDDLVAGDLIVTEIMNDPTCANDDCEWIEVYNNTDQDVNLNGLRIQDALMNPNSEGLIDVDVLLAPGDYAWLGRNTVNEWPYTNPADAHYGQNPALNNGGSGDLVVLLNSLDTILDQTANYMPPPGDAGVSLHLKPDQIDATANDDLNNWCYSTVVFDNPNNVDEFGSPGAANEVECAMI